MAIVRVNKTTGNYYIAHKGYVEDERLSFKAKGIMSYLFSKPDDWVIYQSDVANSSKDGKSSVRTAFNELLELGYLTREVVRKENGDFDGYNYTLHEKPVEQVGEVRKMENAKMENAKMVFAKSDTTNNNLTNNNLTNNNSKSSGQATTHPPYKEVIEYLNEKAGKNFNHKAKGNKKFISARYNEGNSLEDFKYVIDVKVADWLNDKHMKTYLKPETLFNSTNFEKYKNETIEEINERKQYWENKPNKNNNRNSYNKSNSWIDDEIEKLKGEQ